MASVRLRALDVVRGIAVLLMILDHVWLSRGLSCGWLVRGILTRAALPLFMCVSGYLWEVRGVSWRRQIHLLCASAVSVRLAVSAGLPSPDILTLYAVIQLAAFAALRWPLLCAVLSLLQVSEFRIGMPNYEPGVVFGFCCLGVLWARYGQVPALSCRLLEWFGRRPLLWYVGHLLGLAAWRCL